LVLAFLPDLATKTESTNVSYFETKTLSKQIIQFHFILSILTWTYKCLTPRVGYCVWNPEIKNYVFEVK